MRATASSECVRRVRAEASSPSSFVDADWDSTPSHCSSSDAECNYTTLALQNFRPVVSTVNAQGQLSGVLFSGNQQSDWWDDGWESERGAWRKQRAGASLLLREARVVTVRNAVVTSTGSVLTASLRFGARDLDRCRLRLPAVPHADDRCRDGAWFCCSNTEPVQTLLVLAQLFIDAFGHLFFHLLPQLVMLLEHTASWQHPLIHLGAVQRYSSPSALPILLEALGIAPSRVLRAARAEAYEARRAALLQLPRGVCAHTAVYPYGVLRRQQLRLAPPPQHEAKRRDLVVYLQRPCPTMTRCVVNEAALLRTLREAIVPPYQLRVVNPGTGHVVGDAAVGESRPDAATGEGGLSFERLRATMARARVVLGVCGSAWGNAFFSHVAASDVHLVEINSLHGRSSFVKMHHFAGGSSRYWVVEPDFGPRIAAHASRRYESRVRVHLGPLVTALHHAGVARCEPPSPAESAEDGVACNMSRFSVLGTERRRSPRGAGDDEANRLRRARIGKMLTRGWGRLSLHRQQKHSFRD